MCYVCRTYCLVIQCSLIHCAISRNKFTRIVRGAWLFTVDSFFFVFNYFMNLHVNRVYFPTGFIPCNTMYSYLHEVIIYIYIFKNNTQGNSEQCGHRLDKSC